MSKRRYPSMGDLCQLAMNARGRMLHGFSSRQYEIENKPDNSKATSVDKEINTLVIDWMKEHYPDVAVIGEEGNGNNRWRIADDSSYTAIVDPLDGTEPFTLGVSAWTFCISILCGMSPIVSLISDPVGNRVWFAEKGRGSFLNDKPLRVSPAPLAGSTVATLWGHDDIGNIDKAAREITAMRARCLNLWAPAIGGGMVASSQITASLFGYTSVWETAAMKLIVEEAGGKATDLWGNELEFEVVLDGQWLFAPIQGHIISNGVVHDQLLEIIAKVNPRP